MKKNNLKILHLASDEKFINGANYIFEKAFPGANRFIIPVSRFNRKLTYVQDHDNFEYVTFSSGLKLAKTLAKRAEAYDVIILHALYEFNSTVFLLSTVKERFVGIIWGAELYTEENFPKDKLLGDLTGKVILPKPKPKSFFFNNIKNFARRVIYFKRNTIPGATKMAARELRYFGGTEDVAYKVFREKKLVSENIDLIPFTYYPLEFILKGKESYNINGKDILIGNSSAPTNNHLEIFHALKSFKLDDRKIIAPLSYPDAQFGNFIANRGEEIFGGNFIPLLDFMSIDEYNRTLQCCGITIMNHFRAQAFGNLIAMLWMGSKIYLNEANPFFDFFKKKGMIIYSINNDLNIKNNDALINLNEDEIIHNRKILKEEFSEENVIERLQEGIYNCFSN